LAAAEFNSRSEAPPWEVEEEGGTGFQATFDIIGAWTARIFPFERNVRDVTGSLAFSFTKHFRLSNDFIRDHIQTSDQLQGSSYLPRGLRQSNK